MIRLALFTLLLLCFGIFAAWFYEADGNIAVEWLGYKIETRVSVAVIALIALFSAMAFLWRLVAFIKDSPINLMRRFRKTREEKGYKALTLGFSALASGNGAEAGKLAAKARKSLAGEPLALLLSAQALTAQGKLEESAATYREMTKFPEMEFVGFRGLVTHAIRKGDLHKALSLAEDLARHHPKSKWLLEALVDLSMRSREWTKAGTYLSQAVHNRLTDKKDAERKFAVIAYEKALVAKSSGDAEEALAETRTSLKHDRDFAPAVTLLARMLVKSGYFNQAERFILDSWEKFSSRELGEYFIEAGEGLGTDKKLKRAVRLASRHQDNAEAHIARARVCLEAGKLPEAKQALKDALSITQIPAFAALLDALEDGGRPENWEESFASAPCFRCNSCGKTAASWQSFCPSCQAFDSFTENKNHASPHEYEDFSVIR